MNSIKELILDCKYLGKIYSPLEFRNGKKFPFNDNKGLKQISQQLFSSKYNELSKNKIKCSLKLNERMFILSQKDNSENIFFNIKPNDPNISWYCLSSVSNKKYHVFMTLERLDLGYVVCGHIFSIKGNKKIKDLYKIFHYNYLKNDHTEYDFFTIHELNNLPRALENTHYEYVPNNLNTNLNEEYLYSELPELPNIIPNDQENMLNQMYDGRYFNTDDTYILLDNESN
jgi:hypothetical protein